MNVTVNTANTLADVYSSLCKLYTSSQDKQVIYYFQSTYTDWKRLIEMLPSEEKGKCIRYMASLLW